MVGFWECWSPFLSTLVSLLFCPRLLLLDFVGKVAGSLIQSQTIQINQFSPSQQLIMEPKQPIHSPLINTSLYLTQTIIQHKHYNIPFPYEPYEVQKKFMTTVLDALDGQAHALLESPTGTGKTLCLLSSTLTWYRNKVENNPGEKLKIIYASRTHSQLRQVVKQLKNTCFKPKIITAASRDQYWVLWAPEGSRVQEKSQGPSCLVPVLLIRTNFLRQLKKSVNKYLNTDMPLLDLQQLKQLGETENFCPFFFSRSEDYLGQVDLILMPYNYVMDRNVVGIYEKMLTDAVLIIDEAHNIQNVAMDGASMTLGMNMIDLAYEEVKAVQKKAMLSGLCSINNEQFDFLMRFLRKIQNNLESQIDLMKKNLNGEGKMFSWQEMVDLFKQVLHFSSEQSMTKELKAFSGICERLMTEMNEEYLWQLDKTVGYFSLLVQIVEQEGLRNFYRLCYREEDQIGMFELWCIDPSVSFKRLISMGVKNIILTSGTLSPLSSWESELKINFKYQLCNKHVIPPSQVMLNIVQSGPRQEKFIFTYNNRSNQNLNQDVCESIVRLAQNIPNGVVVFFPSNPVMENIVKAMKSTNLLKRLMEIKNFHFEPRGDHNFQVMFKQYKQDAVTKKGAIMFAVCRSRVSEGIDLSDELCRAVIFVGIPYPPIKDMKVMEKRSYQDHLKQLKKLNKGQQKDYGTPIDGQDWYNQQTIRAVNQALGRAIRHKNDYGAIYLMDCRYNSTISLRKELPKWALENLKISNHFQTLIQDTIIFFETNKSLDQLVRPSLNTDDSTQIPSGKKLPRLSLRKQVSNEEVDETQNKPFNSPPEVKRTFATHNIKSKERGSSKNTLHGYFQPKK